MGRISRNCQTTERLTQRADGKWAIHPAQIAPALEVFSPSAEDVAFARKIAAAYHEAQRQGLGAHKSMA